MDETPEEMEQLRREADAIDPYKYRRRNRALAALGLGALMAGIVWAVLEASDHARNPCERVRDYLCAQDESAPGCAAYGGMVDESVNHASPTMRSNIRSQCVTKIERLKEEGVEVP